MKVILFFEKRKKNLKILDISISHLNQIIKLKVICHKIEEVILHISEKNFEFNENELNIIFPNMIFFIKKDFILFDLIRILNYSKIKTLIIVIFDYNKNINLSSEIDSKKILEKISNLEINIEN